MIDTTAPKDPPLNRLYRAGLLAWADTPARQAAVAERCRGDFTWWTDSFVWQFNPNAIGAASQESGPFVLWPFQEEAVHGTPPDGDDPGKPGILRAITERYDVVIEKSREMGASWLCLLVMDWFFLFQRRKEFLCISRNEHAVDRPGDANSLFWKLDYVHEHLPDWMAGCARGDMRAKMTFRHPVTQSAIVGQASTGKAGVGGRCTAMFVDEFSMIDEDFEVLQRTANTTRCRIFNGTHTGVGTAFHQLTDPESIVGSFIRKVRMHWTQHPDKCRGLYSYDRSKNRVERLDPAYEYPHDFRFVPSEQPAGGLAPGLRSPWYDDMCKRIGNPVGIARDLDGCASGSVRQVFDPLLIHTLRTAVACEPVWVGGLRLDRDRGEPLDLYPDPNGPILMWRPPISGSEVPPGKYAAANDLSRGHGCTNSSCTIADARTGVKWLEFATPHLSPDQFAAAVVALCRLFKDENGEGALLIWEDHGPGLDFGKTVHDLGYRRLWKRESQDLFRATVRSDIPGWVPTVKAKDRLLDDYRAALETRRFVNYSDAALRECLAFRWKDRGEGVEHPDDEGGDDRTGARKLHGDRVIADALCWLALQRLGAGRANAPPAEAVVPAAVGSFAWRVELHERAARGGLDAHPIRRHTGVVRGGSRSHF